jgi:hypothetical protein
MAEESPNPAPAPRRGWVPRYHIAHLMLLPVLLVVVLIWMDRKGLLPTRRWTGQRTLTLEFEVSDGEDGRPLEGVRIEVQGPDGKPRASGSTDAGGRASLVGSFDASGTFSAFGWKNDGKILPFRYTLTKAGYQPARGGNTTGYYLGSEPPRPRYRWGLTPIAARNVAAGAK